MVSRTKESISEIVSNHFHQSSFHFWLIHLFVFIRLHQFLGFHFVKEVLNITTRKTRCDTF